MKWFTYCDTIQEDNRRWQRHRGSVGLLFGSDDGEELTREDKKNILADPVVRTLFQDVCYVDEDTDRLVLSGQISFLGAPDGARVTDPPIEFHIKGQHIELSLHRRYSNCRSLLKAIGCMKCPERGAVCLARELPELHQTVPLDDSDLKERWKHGRTMIAGFTYGSPVMTKEGHFEPGLRHWTRHDFSLIKDWAGARSAAGSKAAAHIKFKKTSCATCPVKSHCSSSKHCDGPYPQTDVITKQLLEIWLPRVAKWTGESWQLWTMARCGGRQGRARHGRHVIFSGPVWKTDHWELRAYRTKVRTSEYQVYDTYEDVRELFDLPIEPGAEGSSMLEEPTEMAKALWFLSQDVTYRRSHGGWGGSHHQAVAREMSRYNDTARVVFAGPRHLNTYDQLEIHSYAHLYGQTQNLFGVPQIPVTR